MEKKEEAIRLDLKSRDFSIEFKNTSFNKLLATFSL